MYRIAMVFTMMFFSLFLLIPGVNAEEDTAKLAKLAEKKASETADNPATKDLIKNKLQDACAMLKVNGMEKGFQKMQGDSKYIFGGTYIWVHNLKGVMLMHPIKYKLNGKKVLSLKDPKGNLLFVEMNDKLKKTPDKIRTVDYYWPRPGHGNEPWPKRSWVKLCKVNGKKLVLGCGIYLEKGTD